MMAQSFRVPHLLTAAGSGLLFGAGLYVSQMVDPMKVLRFLDIGGIAAGRWDPSLAFVIVPAIAIMAVAVVVGRRRRQPLFDGAFHPPEQTRIDLPLVAGAALFGIGWGMSGICPGPAIALVAFLPGNLGVFLLALLIGSWLGGLLTSRTRSAMPIPVPAE